MAFLLLFFSLSFATEVSHCTQGKIDGEYLVRYQETLSQFRTFTLNVILKPDRVLYRPKNLKVDVISDPFFSAQAVRRVEPTISVFSNRSEADMQIFLNRGDVLSVEENCLVHSSSQAITNDPLVGKQWYLNSIQAPKAWSKTNGSHDVTVAVIDTGVDIDHEDLIENRWINEAELNGRPGVDDDANGYIDDVYGYNFNGKNPDPRPGNLSDDEHGTHVAGIIAARGNNAQGIAGIAWHLNIMPLRVFASGGDAAVSDMVSAVFYAVDNGARVINSSVGALAPATEAEKQAYTYALNHGVIPFVAAGNNGLDAMASSPASITGVFVVGSTDGSSDLANFSNYGSKVNMLAPGTAIYSTVLNNQYDYLSGTSMSTPIVAGAAALMLSVNNSLKGSDIQKLLMSSASTIKVHQRTGVGSYKFLNVAGAVQLAQKSVSSKVMSFDSEAGQSTLSSESPQSPSTGCGRVSGDSSNSVLSVMILMIPLVMLIQRRRRARFV